MPDEDAEEHEMKPDDRDGGDKSWRCVVLGDKSRTVADQRPEDECAQAREMVIVLTLVLLLAPLADEPDERPQAGAKDERLKGRIHN